MTYSPSTRSALAAALLVLSFSAACGDDGGGDATPPTVTANTPARDATGVALNESVSVTFSEAMDPSTLSPVSFRVTGAGGALVPGTVIYADSRAVFWPSVHLAGNVEFTATLAAAASDMAGLTLEADHVWKFTTGTTLAPGQPVGLGTASSFVVLAKSGVSTVPPSVITGDVGVSPAAASYITGFSLAADATNVFATSPQVTGRVYAADYAAPTAGRLTTAVGDMELAFTDAAGRAPDATELGDGNIGGMTLAPGVYKWGTGLLVPTDVTLAGGATGVWIFQVAQDLTFTSGARVVLSGGALAKNVYWQVSGEVVVGTTAHVEGVVLTQTSATLGTGASINGRLFAQTAVVLDHNAVVEPAR